MSVISDHATNKCLGSVVTQVLTTRAAITTTSTRRNERSRYVIANFNARDTRTDFNNNASTFVTTNDGEETFDAHEWPELFGRNHVASDQVFVAVAQTCSAPVDNHFTGLGWVDFDFLDLPLLIQAPQYGGL